MISLKKLKNTVNGKKVLIDSNIIIYLTDMIQPYDALSKELFTMVEEGKAEAVISIISVAEVMHGPIKAGKGDIAIEVKNYLVNFPNCQCMNITYEVLEKIGNDKRINWKALRSIDSLIIASGLYSKVDLIISNDRHFINALPAEMLFSFES
ncbi:MAG: PIN domain-containing protein [Desulfobacterales bacterium]|nr:PIN domain-containing protein [Desulfobacterales bacterium]